MSSSGTVTWAIAQDSDSGDVIDEIVTIGTRTAGRTAIESPVPVDVLNVDAMNRTGATEVGRAI